MQVRRTSTRTSNTTNITSNPSETHSSVEADVAALKTSNVSWSPARRASVGTRNTEAPQPHPRNDGGATSNAQLLYTATVTATTTTDTKDATTTASKHSLLQPNANPHRQHQSRGFVQRPHKETFAMVGAYDPYPAVWPCAQDIVARRRELGRPMMDEWQKMSDQRFKRMQVVRQTLI